eukprot:587803-Amphidinium_carterae.1
MPPAFQYTLRYFQAGARSRTQRPAELRCCQPEAPDGEPLRIVAAIRQHLRHPDDPVRFLRGEMRDARKANL